MKSFAKPLEKGKWKVYVTNDDYDTYTTIVQKKDPPTQSEMESMYKERYAGYWDKEE
jgi:hypothetical protein